MLKKIILVVILTFSLLLGEVILSQHFDDPFIDDVMAQEGDLESPGFMFNLEGMTHEKITGGVRQSWIRKGINYFFERIIVFLSATVGGLAVLVMSYGGFLIMTSGGVETRRDKGKHYIKFAVIGLVVALSAYILVTLVQVLIQSI
jgi:hypothetical protein